MSVEDGFARLDTNMRSGELRWTDCEDIELRDDDGEIVYSGPRYFRCSRTECSALVTHGMVRTGGCWCGNRRLIVPIRLTTEEKSLLKRWYYPLVQWEAAQIQPVVPEGKEPGWGVTVEKKKYA